MSLLLVLTSCVVVLATLALGFYAIRKMGPGSFRLRAKLLRVFDLSMEIESSRGHDVVKRDGPGS